MYNINNMSFGRSVQNIKLLLCSLFVICLVTLFLFSKYPILGDEDRSERLKLINKIIKTQASNLACRQPNLPVRSPEMMKFVRTVPKIDCSKSGIDWVKCRGTVCSIEETANIQFGPLNCYFTDVYRKNDYKVVHGPSVKAETYELKKSDVVHVLCSAEEQKWSATLVGVRKDEKVWNASSWDKLPKNSLKMNVLMFGFDSLSRNSFIRKLPKSYEYLDTILETDVLQGYNIVGDGTPQALIPMLTGKNELELPDTRKRIKKTKFVNSYPFIWNDYKKSGYVTAFFEDVPKMGTFNYRLNGFNKSPTDHYMRPYYLALLSDKTKWPALCIGENPKHKIMLNLIKEFFTVYTPKPKFLFGFHGELSHDDYNLVGVADDDFLQFLTDLHVSGALNNTILILMADHGHRFAEIRNTLQGKQEERLPFFSFTFPKWFKDKYKHIYNNFKSNLDKLTTPFDIYSTLKNILHMKEVGTADISQRSVSLFSKIPPSRSCASAHIEPHWCACLDWREIPLSDPIVKRIAEKLTNTINSYTSEYRNFCEFLTIWEVYWVTKMEPNENLLRYKKNSDVDGFVADLSAKIDIREDEYQIKAMMVPGNGLFEASVTHELIIDSFKLKISDISRINLYGTQARCIENDLPHLRKYCCCKDI